MSIKIALGVVLTAALAAVPAQAGAPWVRAVDLPNCGGDYFSPCEGASWRLYLSNGQKVKFPDAARYATEPDGSLSKDVEDGPAPFVLSGDRRHLAYVRACDGKVVVRPWPKGRATVLPALGKASGTGYMRLNLSHDGRYLAVDYSLAEKKGHGPGLLIDATTGRTVRTFPAGDEVIGFSADGDEVLARRPQSDNTIHVVVLGANGSEVSDVPPQAVVSHNAQLALEGDGRTAVVVNTPPNGGYETVRRYDLASPGWVGPAQRISVRGGSRGLGWGSAGRLEFTHVSGDEADSVVTTYSLDPATGRARKLDRYMIRFGVPR
ncbi:hypothetical protein ACIBEJ_23010 [Nonomuraea sp. NPDC050790]|uniref:hypothetical protein n=1 Tax=Nonomuraea sp. NPDC050790 TaxID=3364371 RepID=UPI0037AF56DE